ncbi:hypothetical protein ADUPG1_006097 [Aduncisulcus paluster]|uniref:Sugar phosphate transporter domain-containing protein n=1 Tax=Aduncisulcus paluster TaxID=2918883 RepID=A0ABQ5KGS1_9EUKA|nr:hypothetical protein ADUPG1_006097 [Aduncisulcus paluster]
MIDLLEDHGSDSIENNDQKLDLALGNDGYQRLFSDGDNDEFKTGPEQKKTVDIVLVTVYLVSATAMPLMNYYVFTEQFEYPILSTAVQLFITAIIMFFWNISFHFRCVKEHIPHTWIFEKIWWKILCLLPATIVFTLDISLNNCGLAKCGVSIHVLIKATGIIWNVLFSAIFKMDFPNKFGCICCVILVVGGAMVFGEALYLYGWGSETSVGVLLTFSASILGGLYTVLISRSMKRLKLNFSLPMHPTETTCINIGMMSLIMFMFDPLVEPHAYYDLFHIDDGAILLSLFGGVVLTACMKLTMIWIVSRNTPIGMGVISQTKLAPQVLLDIFCFHKYPINFFMILGTIIICVGAIMYGFEMNRKKKSKK